MQNATTEQVKRLTHQALLALAFNEKLASRVGWLLGSTLSGAFSDDKAVLALKGLFQDWTKYYASELGHIDDAALATIDQGSVKNRDREVEVVVRLGPVSQLYRAICDPDPDTMKFRFAHEAAFVIAGIQNLRMVDWLEKCKTDRSSLLPFVKTPLAVIDSQQLLRLQRLIEDEAALAVRWQADKAADKDSEKKAKVYPHQAALDDYGKWIKRENKGKVEKKRRNNFTKYLEQLSAEKMEKFDSPTASQLRTAFANRKKGNKRKLVSRRRLRTLRQGWNKSRQQNSRTNSA